MTRETIGKNIDITLSLWEQSRGISVPRESRLALIQELCDLFMSAYANDEVAEATSGSETSNKKEDSSVVANEKIFNDILSTYGSLVDDNYGTEIGREAFFEGLKVAIMAFKKAKVPCLPPDKEFPKSEFDDLEHGEESLFTEPDIEVTEDMAGVLEMCKKWYLLPDNGAGGCLHTVLDDENVTDDDLVLCAANCSKNKDALDILNNLFRLTIRQRLWVTRNVMNE